MTANKRDRLEDNTSLRATKILNRVVLGFCFLITTNIPANAVDYLQCREMVRTKNEMIDKSVQAEYNNGLGYISETEIEKKHCPDAMFMMPNPSYIGFNKQYNIVPAETVDYASQKRCVNEQKQILLDKVKPYKKIGTKVFYTKSGYDWFLSAIKVSNDMKKRQCPYQ